MSEDASEPVLEFCFTSFLVVEGCVVLVVEGHFELGTFEKFGFSTLLIATEKFSSNYDTTSFYSSGNHYVAG